MVVGRRSSGLKEDDALIWKHYPETYESALKKRAQMFCKDNITQQYMDVIMPGDKA